MAGHCWKCRIMPVRVSENGTTTPAGIATGSYAVDHGAKIINVSFAHRNYDSGEAEAVRYAAERGAIVVASAGTRATTSRRIQPRTPACSRSARRTWRTALYWSSRGPGWVERTCATWSPTRPRRDGRRARPSRRAPSLALGLLWSRNPILSREQVLSAVLGTARTVPGVSLVIDPRGSVPAARPADRGTPAAAPPTPTPRPAPASGSRARPSSRRAFKRGFRSTFRVGRGASSAAAGTPLCVVLSLSQQGGRAHRRSARRQESDQPVDPGHYRRPVHRGSAVPRCPDSAVLARCHRDVPSRP